MITSVDAYEAELKAAATVVLVRDAPAGGLEVLMVKRSEDSSFMGGVYVFPGGGLDEADSAPWVTTRAVGRAEEEASTILGLAEGGLAYWVSAVRELFEESGILLATDREGRLVELIGETAERFTAHRDALNAREWTFAEMIEAEDLVLGVDLIHYAAHWVTPVGGPKRFDTRFFVGEAPESQEAIHDAVETVAIEWVTPANALKRHREGEIEMVMPTIRTLHFIEGFSGAAELTAHVVAMTEIPRIEPRMVKTATGTQLVVPGDEHYDSPEIVDDTREFKGAARRRAVKENPPSG